MTSQDKINTRNIMDTHLEPRVAKLEAGLDILTRNVSDLTAAVRDNASSLEGKIERLTVAVTEAQAPRRTDWGVIISGMFLILAIGSAVFWPLNQKTEFVMDNIKEINTKFEQHLTLPLHPVGAAKVDYLDKIVIANKEEMIMRDANLDSKIQRETQLMTDLVNSRISDLDLRIQKEFNIKGERTDARLIKLEERNREMDLFDQTELRAWRNRASGLSSPDVPIPLSPKDK